MTAVCLPYSYSLTIVIKYFYYFFVQKILMPYTYILQVPGKQIRKKLSLAFNYWLRVSDDKLRAIGEIVQMLHNSSLLWVNSITRFKLYNSSPITRSAVNFKYQKSRTYRNGIVCLRVAVTGICLGSNSETNLKRFVSLAYCQTSILFEFDAHLRLN